MKSKYTSVSPPKPAYKARTVSLPSLKSQLTSDCNRDYQMWSTTRIRQISSTHFWKRTLSFHVTISDNCRSACGDRCPSSFGPSLGHRARDCWRAQAQGWSTWAPGLVLKLSSTRTKARYFAASGYHQLICKTGISTCLRVLLWGWHDLMNVSCSSQYSNTFL